MTTDGRDIIVPVKQNRRIRSLGELHGNVSHLSRLRSSGWLPGAFCEIAAGSQKTSYGKTLLYLRHDEGKPNY